MRRAHVVWSLALALASGCAALPKKTAAPDTCGNPCQTTTCPSAFRCEVDAHCGTRCQPEAVKPR